MGILCLAMLLPRIHTHDVFQCLCQVLNAGGRNRKLHEKENHCQLIRERPAETSSFQGCWKKAHGAFRQDKANTDAKVWRRLYHKKIKNIACGIDNLRQTPQKGKSSEHARYLCHDVRVISWYSAHPCTSLQSSHIHSSYPKLSRKKNCKIDTLHASAMWRKGVGDGNLCVVVQASGFKGCALLLREYRVVSPSLFRFPRHSPNFQKAPADTRKRGATMLG